MRMFSPRSLTDQTVFYAEWKSILDRSFPFRGQFIYGYSYATKQEHRWKIKSKLPYSYLMISFNGSQKLIEDYYTNLLLVARTGPKEIMIIPGYRHLYVLYRQ